VAKGGYVLRNGDDVVLIATGSEVALALEAADLLAAEGVSARVVSLPCWELFFAQDEAVPARCWVSRYPGCRSKPAARSGGSASWARVSMIGIDRFGASAPADVLAEQFGFTARAIADRVGETVRR
jgi:transketolase